MKNNNLSVGYKSLRKTIIISMEKDKKIKIHNLTEKLLNDSYVAMQQNIYKAINSGVLDIESWDETKNPTVIPKIIVITLLEKEAEHYNSISFYYHKHIETEIQNLKNSI